MTMLERITRTEYHPFNPPRHPEEFQGIAGPHAGLALPYDVLQAMAEAKVANRPHPYIVRGEWVRSDGVRFLDVAVARQWVTQNTNYQLIDGRLRWQCPSCGKLSGTHAKACGYE